MSGQPAAGQVEQSPQWAVTDMSLRPVLLTTEAEIQRAQARRADTSSPFHQAWLSVQSQANVALDFQFTPQEWDDVAAFYEDANLEGRRLHTLAVAYRVSGNAAYLTKARNALVAWAVFSNADLPPGDPTPSWRDFHYPGKAMPHAAGLHISRTLVIFADAYAMLQPYLSAADRAQIERWFASMRSPIQRSTLLWQTANQFHSSLNVIVSAEPPWLNRQYYNNHLTAHVLGQLAIGYVTGNENLVSYALSHADNPRDLRELFGGVLVMPGDALQERDPSLGADNDRWPDPLRSEVYDRYRAAGATTPSGDRGLIYAALGQRFLALSTELATNNGAPVDYWRHIADSGENLRDSYATYAPFLSTPANAVACRGRYYEDSANTSNMIANWRAMTEMAFREYPYDPAIRAVARTATSRNYNDVETFGPSAPLLDGELLDPPGGPTWTYRSTTGSTATPPLQTRAGADAHFLGDWDGDGDDTPGWRAGTTFYLSNSPTGAGPLAYSFGTSCDEALVGDWDGDGDDTIGVRRGKTFLLSNDNVGAADISYTAGRASDRVMIGDWNGDRIDTPGLIRGKGMFLRTSNKAAEAYLPYFEFARIGDRFLAGDWNGDGIDTLAAVRETGSALTWYLKSGNTEGSPVTVTLTHGGILNGVAAGNVSGGAADELAAIRYR